jgi:hypothetical protein
MKYKTKTTFTLVATSSDFVSCTLRKHSTMNRINHFRILLFLSCLCVSSYALKAQLSYKVLFLGNSYTGVNNLPQMVHDLALSAGDTLIFDSHTPGGYQLIDHSNDVTSQNKIMAGGWDYVVIQGQSQEPIMTSNQFYSGGGALYNQIKQYNPCAVTMPYMTWGRKNGDASNCAAFPVMCTYQGMDTTLRSRYLMLTNNIDGEVSPVSVVWNYLRQNFPDIELYQADESHPSLEGSYAAACCFYAALFKKDPSLITNNFGLNATDAAIIRNAAKTQVFDSLQAWDFGQPAISEIGYEIGPGSNEILFGASGQALQSYWWDFGDGSTSSSNYQSHSYLNDGTYTVSLTTTNCDLQGLHTSFSDTIVQFCSHTPTIFTSHPWLCNDDTLWTQTADSYQWFLYDVPLPETNQFLANYNQYNLSGFRVISTVNGCSELSGTFTETPQWSGYYFDATGFGDPCLGDTVSFTVLHIDGFLSGFENILWYKNDILLPLMINEDTIFISAEGTYKCEVINPNSNCPLDTTFFSIEIDCGTVGIADKGQSTLWNIFPNPATETISIHFMNDVVNEQIQIYNVFGHITKEIEARPKMEVNIADLPNGLYYIRLKNNSQSVLRFIKQ